MLFECGALGDPLLEAVLGPGVFEVADLAEEVGDVLTLLTELSVRAGGGLSALRARSRQAAFSSSR
jgi:hypothetical protein